jgi:MYXO-CTERM domain-containing protein
VVRIILATSLIALVAVAVAGCVEADEPTIASRRSALGEPMNGFPSAAERLGIMAINRARSDPNTVQGNQSATYAARPPVMWSYDLSRSSRFHATNLRLTNVTLMHDSPCPLNTNVATSGCDGAPACACTTMMVGAACAACAPVAATNNGCGTPTFTRIGYFTAGTTTRANGEVAAAGYTDAMAVVDGWMDEASGADGHRRNLTDQGISSNVMGYGRVSGTGCFNSFDVSDSGNVTGLAIAKLPTAAVRGPIPGVTGYSFYATWADPAMGAPASINVVVDGNCTVMAREIGNDMFNATYKAVLPLAAGCHNYFVVARDAAGTTLSYPTTGAITIPVGSATACTADFLATAPAATCTGDGGTPPPPPPTDAGADRGAGAGGATGTGAGGNRGAGGAPGTTGAGGAPGTTGAGGSTGATGAGGAGVRGSGGGGGTTAGDAGTPPTGGGGTTGATAGASGTTPPGDSINGGCSCAVAGTSSASMAGGSLLVFAILLRARRRLRK